MASPSSAAAHSAIAASTSLASPSSAAAPPSLAPLSLAPPSLQPLSYSAAHSAIAASTSLAPLSYSAAPGHSAMGAPPSYSAAASLQPLSYSAAHSAMAAAPSSVEIKLAGGNWFGIRLAAVYNIMNSDDQTIAYELLNNISDIDYHLEAKFPIDHTNQELNSLIEYCEKYIENINCGMRPELNPSYLKTKFSLARITQLIGELFDLSTPDITTYLGMILHSNLSEEQKKLYELVIIICLLPEDPKTQKRIDRLRLYVEYILNPRGHYIGGATRGGARRGINPDVEPECSDHRALDILSSVASNIAASSICSDSTMDFPFHADIETLTDAAESTEAAEIMLSFARADDQVPFLLQPIRNIDSTINLLKEQLEQIKLANERINTIAQKINKKYPGTFNCQDGLSISEASKKASQYLGKPTFVQIYNNELEHLIKEDLEEKLDERTIEILLTIHRKLKYKKMEIAFQTKLNACSLLQLYNNGSKTPIYKVLEDVTTHMTDTLNGLLGTVILSKRAFDFSREQGKDTLTHCATLIEQFCIRSDGLMINWMERVLSNDVEQPENRETIKSVTYGQSQTEFDRVIIKQIAKKVGEPSGLKFTTNIFIDAPPKRKRPQSPPPTSKITKTQTHRSRSAPPTKRKKGGRSKNKPTKKKTRKIKPTKKKTRKIKSTKKKQKKTKRNKKK